MKNLKISYLLVFLSITTFAKVRPEPIPSKLTELKSKGWYNERFTLWKKFMNDNPTDKNGWIELFKSAKYSGASDEELQIISTDVNKYHPESAEAEYVKASLIGWTDEGVSSLENALIKSNTDDFLEARVLLAEFKLSDDREIYSDKVFESGLVHSSTLNYAYNVLMSVVDNGILITEATHTTIPLWVLQDVMSVREDVEIINLELAENSSYLSRKFEDLGIKSSETIFDLPESNPDSDFFYALTLPRKHISAIDSRLYVVGLASQYESDRLDQYGSLKENLENRFLLDYLTIDFNGEPNSSTGKVLEANYLVPLVLLKEYYDEYQQFEKSDFFKDRLLLIADRNQLKSQVDILLAKGSKNPTDFKKVEIDIKTLDRKLQKVKGNIYASHVELTNKEFEFFLKYLKDNEYDDIFEKVNIDLSKYEGFSYNFHKSYHFMGRPDMKKGNYGDYPTMDITYEAAKIYCEWLTAQYNAQEGREFEKVKFRLPSKNEWTMAALGYTEFQSWNLSENTVTAYYGEKNKKQNFSLNEHKVSYPWYGEWEFRNTVMNNKGCYLANVKVSDEKTCPAEINGDGFEITSPVGTYFSNGMGLYDVIGNVAEMTDINGIAMGGSWNHLPEESTITSEVSYSGPDTTVGFRLFMEVIEE
ncbi:formylglycine-generating enzyme family protein [Ekhidna lutea]|nr:SUMF1/EgtB/PvdO family nonheme iron enzyme [Ekhidna lutea]